MKKVVVLLVFISMSLSGCESPYAEITNDARDGVTANLKAIKERQIRQKQINSEIEQIHMQMTESQLLAASEYYNAIKKGNVAEVSICRKKYEDTVPADVLIRLKDLSVEYNDLQELIDGNLFAVEVLNRIIEERESESNRASPSYYNPNQGFNDVMKHQYQNQQRIMDANNQIQRDATLRRIDRNTRGY